MTHPRRVRAASAALALTLALASTPALAGGGSPWVLPESATVLQLDFRTEFADREFLPDGTNQAFPLKGKFSAQTLGLNVRRGFGAGFEASLALSYKAVAYNADPVTIFGPVALDGDGNTVDGQVLPTFSVNNQSEGLADIYASVRWNIYKGAIIITPELEVKIPGGYASPDGTFIDDDPGLKVRDDGTFEPQTLGEVPTSDDVALGDGQVDITASLLLGTFIPPTRTFARAGAGFKARFGGAGQQFVGDFKLGQLIGKHLIIFASTQAVITLTDGEVIGQSFATLAPDTKGQLFPLSAFEFIDLRLDKDYVDFSGGGIFKVGAYELILTGGKILDGKNITESVFVSFSTSYRY